MSNNGWRKQWTRWVFLLITIGACLGFPRLEFASDATFVTGDHLDTDGLFSIPELLIVSAPESIAEPGWDRVSETTVQLSAIEGVETVVSPTTTADLAPSTDTIEWHELTPSQAATNPLWQHLFRGRGDPTAAKDDVRWWMTYVRGDDIEPLRRWYRNAPEIYLSGVEFYNDILVRETRGDFLVVVPVGAALILVVYLLVVRAPATALRLWIVSLIPGLWVLGLFGWGGISLGWWTMIVPLQAIALGTSYGLHVLHYEPMVAARPLVGTAGPSAASYRAHARGVRPVVFRAAVTTALGFATLVISPVEELRRTGVLIILGVGLSVLAALVLLPALGQDLVLAPFRGQHARRAAGLAAAQPEHQICNRPRAHQWLDAALVVVVVVGAWGVTRIVPGSFFDTLFNARSAAHPHIVHMAEAHGIVDTVEVVVDTGERYGYVETGMFDRVADLEDQLRAVSGVNTVLGPTLFVDHAFGRLTGSQTPRTPETAADIGETLELLRSSDDRTGISQLVSGDYRFLRVVVHYGALTDTPRTRRIAVNRIGEIVQDSHAVIEAQTGGSAQLAGASHARRISLETSSRQYAGSVLLFVPVVFMVLVIWDRKPGAALQVVTSVVCGALVYGGAQGLLGIPFRFATILGLAFVLGVSADDAIYVVRSGGEGDTGGAVPAHARRAVLHTTALMLAGLAPVYFSRFRALQEMVLLMSLGLAAATIVSLYVVPRLAAALRGSHG